MSSREHSETVNPAPVEEQQICINCGFCCDGTLFHTAGLKPGERGHLPERIDTASFRDGENEYFYLPCEYFFRKCTIYDKKKAYVCSAYRCQLLKDFTDGKFDLTEALVIVNDSVCMRAEILKQYRLISGSGKKIWFRRVLRELGKINECEFSEKQEGMSRDMLIARCNIFEALLIKYFRSSDDFEKMIMK